MSAKVTETDLAELKELIVNSQKTIDNRLTSIDNRLISIDDRLRSLEIGQEKLDGNIKTLEATLKGDIKTVDEKLDGVSTRLGILESKTSQQLNWFLTIVTGLVGGVLTFLFRSFPPTA